MHPTPHMCTWGEWCVIMYVHIPGNEGEHICVLQTCPGVSMCVHVFMCAHGGLLTALLMSLLQGPCEAQGGCLLPESCVLARPGGAACLAWFSGQQEHFLKVF